MTKMNTTGNQGMANDTQLVVVIARERGTVCSGLTLNYTIMSVIIVG